MAAFFIGTIAKLVMHGTANPWGVGSNPAGSSILPLSKFYSVCSFIRVKFTDQ